MKPHKNFRRGKGYCCEYEDGPLKKWNKRQKKKRADKAIDKKELTKIVNEVIDRHHKVLKRLKD